MFKRVGIVLGVSLVMPAQAFALSAHTSSSMDQQIAKRSAGPADSQSAPVTHSQTKPKEEKAALQRTLTIDIRQASLESVLKEIQKQTGANISYSPQFVPLQRTVTLHASDITVQAALEKILEGTGVKIIAEGVNKIILVRETRVPQDSTKGALQGNVIDAATNAPIYGANVQIVGATFGALTNSSGQFQISSLATGAYMLRVTRLGYQAQSIPVVVRSGVSSPIRVELTATANVLNDVITTASGTQKRLEIGNSIASINADSVVTNSPILNLSDLIATRAPGVQMVTSSGVVGAPTRTRIRGVSSVSGSNDPIVFVDGVRLETSLTERGNPMNQFNLVGDVATNTVVAGRFDDIDPNMIETIDILKGPSAATLYGSDAANGVIVITTKRGRPGPARWRFSGDYGTSKMKATFAESYRGWGTSSVTGPGTSCTLLQVVSGICARIDSVTSFNPLNDPETTPFGTGYDRALRGEISGGSPQFQYFFGGTLSDKVGLLRMPAADRQRINLQRNGEPIPDWQDRPNGMKRQNVTSRIMAKLPRKSQISLSTSFVRQSQANMNDAQVVAQALRGPGYRDTVYDGWYQNQTPAQLFAPSGTSDIMRSYSSLQGSSRPVSWFSVRGTVGVDYTDRTDQFKVRTGDIPNLLPQNDGARGRAEENSSVYSVDAAAVMMLPVTSAVSSRTTVGVQYNRRNYKVLSLRGTGMPLGSETFESSTGTRVFADRFDARAVAGWYIEQTAITRDRLFLTAALRQDAGSSFGRNFKAPVYPKLSLSWLLSDEPFFARLPIVSSVRLRSAYGHAGVQPSVTGAIQTFSSGEGFVNGIRTGAAFLGSIGNTRLSPERSTEFEGGADVELWNNRFGVELTFYRKLSKDAIINRTLPPSLGYPSPSSRQENLGAVLNTGTELVFRGTPLDKRNVAFDFRLGLSANRNELQSLVAGVTSVGGNQEYNRVGYPVSAHWERPILGFNDANGNGIIEPDEVVIGDSLVFMGQPMPPRRSTLMTTFSFFNRTLRISSSIDYQGGMGQWNSAGQNQCGNNLCRSQVDPSTPLAEQVRAVAAWALPFDQRTGYGYSQTVAWTRWNELSISYQLPGSVTQLFHGRNTSVMLMGRNLKLWSKYTGADPAVNSRPIRNYIIDTGAMPFTRDWMMRFNVEL